MVVEICLRHLRVRFCGGADGSARWWARPVGAAEDHAKDAAEFVADQVAADPRSGTVVENDLPEGWIRFWANDDNAVKRNARQAPGPAGFEVGGVDDDEVGIGGIGILKRSCSADRRYRPAAMVACKQVDNAFSHPPVGDCDDNFWMVCAHHTFVPRKGSHLTSSWARVWAAASDQTTEPGCGQSRTALAVQREAGLPGTADKLGPVAHIELLMDVGPVSFDGSHRHVEPGADLGVCEPERDHA